ncbi:hypothetical protein M758_6G029200 [Ceratodon purpureus]|nr:hypothetical protein M758_6G029200 [Ceratodon purpureus]
MAVGKYLVAVAFAVLLSLQGFTNVVDYAQADVIVLPEDELSALQDLYRNWEVNTKDVSTTLPGWKRFDPSTSYDSPDYVDPCYFSSWRGVFCYIAVNSTATSEVGVKIGGDFYDASVVSLEVSDAAIIGNLPDSLWNFNKLVSVILTGNPGLTGPIPVAPTNDNNLRWSLKSLDLHGNGLNETIPDMLFRYSDQIEDLDLSNNHLEGRIPQSLALNHRLKTLNLSNNNLSGSLPRNISENWGELVLADLSSNKFTGSLPNLTTASSLHTLNFSHNEFGGEIDLNLLSIKTVESLAKLDLSVNNFTGALPNLGAWYNLQILNLRNNTFDAGPFPPWLYNHSSLQTLDLRNTNLTGEINLSILNSSKQLRTLYLDDNNITGTLDFDSLLIMNGSLQSISLKNNRIGKVIFSSNDVSNLPTTLELRGNPFCGTKTSDIQRCLCEQRCYNTDPSSNKGMIIGSAVGGSLGAVMMIIAAILYWKNRRDRRYLLLTVHEKFAEYEMKPTLFAYSELQKATRDFHPDNKLGEGGFGAVYKGTLADGSVVAVKQLLTRAQQSMDDFLNEVVLLTTVKHRNLVKLKGCCLRGDRRLLVYEFVDNYDLAETLFEHRGNQVVSWPARFNICLGVAQGLHYLHAGVDPRIIHRDIKANNVLLDHNLHPKIADFGLAMLFPNEDTHVTIVQIAGTKGYLAPEYATRGQVSDKVDVFSFGVLALEVVSGRKNISFDVPTDKAYLTDWAWKLNEEGRLMEIVDPTLSIQSDEEVAVHRVITTALACIQTAAERRPNMAHVVGMLQGDIEITEAVRGGLNENVNHLALLGLNSSATTLMPVDEESQAMLPGPNSSSGSGPRALIELSAIRAR